MPDQYQVLRSVADNHVIVICRDGEFHSLPDDVRHRGPWQGLRRGAIEGLRPEYWLDIQEQGFVLLRTELPAFQPEG